jgi:hypothetical protein
MNSRVQATRGRVGLRGVTSLGLHGAPIRVTGAQLQMGTAANENTLT